MTLDGIEDDFAFWAMSSILVWIWKEYLLRRAKHAGDVFKAAPWHQRIRYVVSVLYIILLGGLTANAILLGRTTGHSVAWIVGSVLFFVASTWFTITEMR